MIHNYKPGLLLGLFHPDLPGGVLYYPNAGQGGLHWHHYWGYRNTAVQEDPLCSLYEPNDYVVVESVGLHRETVFCCA